MCTRPESDDASCSPSSSVLGVGRIPPPNSVDEHSYAADYRERKRLVVETTREAREESAGRKAWTGPASRGLKRQEPRATPSRQAESLQTPISRATPGPCPGRASARSS